MEINGIKYEISIDRNQNIKVISNRKAPTVLSKYFELSERSVLSVINSQLYTSIPPQLNDVFDSLFKLIDYEHMKNEDLREIFLKNHGDQAEQELHDSELKEKVKISMDGLWNHSMGFICLIENQTSDLMWAHYSQNNGFLVEYDTSQFPESFSSAIPISYLPPKYNLNLTPTTICELLEITHVLPFLKKKIWEYENEFRILFSRSKRDTNSDWQIQNIPKSTIQKLILGPHFFKDLYDLDISDTNVIDFNRPKGPIRKLLIDHALGSNIPMEHINMDMSRRDLVTRNIIFDDENLKMGVYRLKYTDS